MFGACRNVSKLKKAGARGLLQSKGFVPVGQEPGTLIAYATAEGELASDLGEGAGPYAKVLAEEIVNETPTPSALPPNPNRDVSDITQSTAPKLGPRPAEHE